MQALSLRELEQQARERLDPARVRLLRGRRRRRADAAGQRGGVRALGLVPRVLRGGGRPRAGGRAARLPRLDAGLIAPTAFHRLAHPDGERATARAAAAAGTIDDRRAWPPPSRSRRSRAARRAAACGSSSTSSPTWASPRRWSGGPRPPAARALVVTRRLAGVRPARARPAQRLRRPAGGAVLREHARRATARRVRSDRIHAGALAGSTSSGCASDDRAADRAQGRPAPRGRPARRSSTASTRWSSPTTAAASSTPCRPPSTCSRRSSTPSAARCRCCSTAASGAAPTS